MRKGNLTRLALLGAATLAMRATVGCAIGADLGQSAGGAADAGDGGSTDATTGGADVVTLGTGDGAVDVQSDGPCTLQCSEDLRSVVSCDTGQTVTTCPPDQGCGNGTCVSLCESAALNESSIGCEYYSVMPGVSDLWNLTTGSCFAAFLANSSPLAVDITVDYLGAPLGKVADFARIPTGSGRSIQYDPLPNGQLPPGQIAILFLQGFVPPGTAAPLSPCPAGIVPALRQDGSIHDTAVGSAFHITTSAPVVAYDIFPYGGGQSAITSATLLLPRSAFGTNYVLVDAFRKSPNEGMNPFIQIVAGEDGTDLTLVPTAQIESGQGVPGGSLGAVWTYSLAKGQTLQIMQEGTLAGSALLASKPIGVWGGSNCIDIDLGDEACDGAHQQLAPVGALGNEYVAVRYRNRYDVLPADDAGTRPEAGSLDSGNPLEAGLLDASAEAGGKEGGIPATDEVVPWRIMAAVDGTVLSYEPSAPAGAPQKLDAGALAEFWTSAAFVVRSQDKQHPFYVSGHMTGCGKLSPPDQDDCRGDPEFVSVIPADQYLSAYTFFTDTTYPETNLVVVRKKSSQGTFDDVVLDCAGPLTGWQPLGEYEFTRTDLVRHDFAKQGACDNGFHAMHSTTPFGLTVWGWGSSETGDSTNGGFTSTYVSYAYPAGARTVTINSVIVSPVPK